jgi:hypothetical protein
MKQFVILYARIGFLSVMVVTVVSFYLRHLSIDAVRRFYERAHQDCCMIYDRLPSPKRMQTLVQVWKWG